MYYCQQLNKAKRCLHIIMRYSLLCSLGRCPLCTKTSSAESSIFQNALIPYEQ